jgi:hypothetical protein
MGLLFKIQPYRKSYSYEGRLYFLSSSSPSECQSHKKLQFHSKTGWENIFYTLGLCYSDRQFVQKWVGRKPCVRRNGELQESWCTYLGRANSPCFVLFFNSFISNQNYFRFYKLICCYSIYDLKRLIQ